MGTRGGSAHNGECMSGAVRASAWLGEGLCIRVIPEVYNGWNDPEAGI